MMKKKAPKKKGKKKVIKKVVSPVDGIYQQSIKYASEAFRAGHSESEIAAKIKETFPVLTEANIQFAIHKGSKAISTEYARDSKSIVSLHVKRYNKEIEKLMDKSANEELFDEDDEEALPSKMLKRKRRIYVLMTCLDVMNSKEKVLQLHTKETQVKVFNQLNAKIKDRKVMFNLQSLSLEEKIEFLGLIGRCKKTDNELFSVIASTEEQRIIEDVEHEEVPNNNVDQVKQTNLPSAVKVRPKKTLNDLTQKIHQTLAKKALEQFIKKGGVKHGPKEIDYTDV